MLLERSDGSNAHLVYCTNVHPAETLEEVEHGLIHTSVPLKQRLSVGGPFGVGLYLSETAVSEALEGDRLERLHKLLDEHGLYVPTLNAFPIGGFHGDRVKEAVFEPKWTEKRRIEYTKRCIEVLAKLLPSGVRGAISTHTGGLKPFGEERPERLKALGGMTEVAAHMHIAFEEHGCEMALALEPEPFSMLESFVELEDFFVDLVWKRAAEFFIKEIDFTLPESREVLPDRLGVCLDACHLAVMYEGKEQVQSLLATERAKIHKLQISSALAIEEPKRNRAGIEALKAFGEPRWFHQVIAKKGDKIRKELDLDAFLASGPGFFWKRMPSWRIHYHVPIFVDRIGPLNTTRGEMRELVRTSLRENWTSIYEIETYTFDALPEDARDGIAPDDLVGLLEREYREALELMNAEGYQKPA